MIHDLNRWFDAESVKILEDEFSLIEQRLKSLEVQSHLKHISNPVKVSGFTAPPDDAYLQLERHTFTHRLNKR